LPGKDLADVLKDRMVSSVRYGLEMAMMHKGFADLARSLKKDSSVLVPVSALVFAASKNIKEEIKKIIDKGYTNIKVKVGRARLDQEIDALNHVSDLLSNERNDISLRIDSNASWDLKDAIHFAKSIDKRYVDYIEDPVYEIKEYPIFYQETALPIALDERFADFEKEFALSKDIGFIKAVIIKPNYIGGFSRSEEIMNRYSKKGVSCVLSNSFETGLSISSILLFACKMGLTDIAIGIDTLKYFKNDILKNPISIHSGCIDLSQIELDENNIDFSILEKIS
jgi:o-succinylbenzoate synthase